MGVDTTLTGVPQFDQLEIVKTGSISVNKAANTSLGTTVFSHNLGYIPVCIAFFEFNTNPGLIQIPLPYVSVDSVGRTDNLMYIIADNDELTVALYAPNLGGSSPYTLNQTFTVRYYLLRQTAR